MSSLEEDYRQSVYNIWAISKLARSFANELMTVMLENGFLIDTVLTCVSCDDFIEWKGRCYDEDCTMFKFRAEWVVNLEKFSRSDMHYYDLTELEIEPQ